VTPTDAASRPILRLHIRRLVVGPGLGALSRDAFATALEAALSKRLSLDPGSPAGGDVADRVADGVWSQAQGRLPHALSTALSPRRSTRP
jgi:hypothetical protein